MAVVSFQLIFVSFLVISCIFVEQVQSNAHRRRRQVLDGTVRNTGVQARQPGESINTQFNPSNVMVSNERNNDPQSKTNNPLGPAQSPAVRARGYYNSPEYQRSPFAAEKSQGWFGTNHPNWLSNQATEIDKNKLDGSKMGAPSNLQGKMPNTIANSAGPLELRKIAEQYASKGDKAFNFGKHETIKGRGAVCTNHDNFNGYTFGIFPCPLPAGTGMNQRNQFCCGPQNYQYCCNAEEFSQSQRGSHVLEGDGRRVRMHRPSARGTVLATVLPIAGFLAVTVLIFVLYIQYQKRRQQQPQTGKPTGASRLPDTYSVVPQEPPEADKPISTPNDETNPRA